MAISVLFETWALDVPEWPLGQVWGANWLKSQGRGQGLVPFFYWFDLRVVCCPRSIQWLGLVSPEHWGASRPPVAIVLGTVFLRYTRVGAHCSVID